jgi:RHS repeat-associated protein
MHYYYLKDHLGDIKMILDESGTPQVWNDYYPFGETMPGRSVFNAGPDTRYQYTGKEYDTETGYDWFNPTRSYNPWRAGFNSPDRHADLYHSWSPYAYSLDNPVLLVDQTGMDPGDGQNQGNQSTSNWNWQFGPNGTYIFFQSGTSNQGTPSNAFSTQQVQEVQKEFKYYTKQVESGGRSLLNFAQQTADAASTTYFWAGVATGAGAGIAAYFGQVEIAEPLANISETSFTLAGRAALANAATTVAESFTGMKSRKEAISEVLGTAEGFAFGHLIDVAPVSTSTRIAGEFLENQSEEALKTWIQSMGLQPAH